MEIPRAEVIEAQQVGQSRGFLADLFYRLMIHLVINALGFLHVNVQSYDNRGGGGTRRPG